MAYINYIYIYICVCVCVFIMVYINNIYIKKWFISLKNDFLKDVHHVNNSNIHLPNSTEDFTSIDEITEL